MVIDAKVEWENFSLCQSISCAHTQRKWVMRLRRDENCQMNRNTTEKETFAMPSWRFTLFSLQNMNIGEPQHYAVTASDELNFDIILTWQEPCKVYDQIHCPNYPETPRSDSHVTGVGTTNKLPVVPPLLLNSRRERWQTEMLLESYQEFDHGTRQWFSLTARLFALKETESPVEIILSCDAKLIQTLIAALCGNRSALNLKDRSRCYVFFSFSLFLLLFFIFVSLFLHWNYEHQRTDLALIKFFPKCLTFPRILENLLRSPRPIETEPAQENNLNRPQYPLKFEFIAVTMLFRIIKLAVFETAIRR